MGKMKFSKMGQDEDKDKNHYKISLRTFKEEASIKNSIAEVKWLGCEHNVMKFTIKNLSKNTIPFSPDKIKIIDSADNILVCKSIDSPPIGWISNYTVFDIYDDMMVKFIFAIPGMASDAVIKRFVWTQQFYIGGGWLEDFSIFDFILATND